MKNIVYYSCSCGKVDGASTTVRDATSEVYKGMTANKCCREALVTDSRTGKRRKVFNNTVWDNNDAVCPNCGDGMIASEGCKNCESIGRKVGVTSAKDDVQNAFASICMLRDKYSTYSEEFNDLNQIAQLLERANKAL